jgi:hypothetical protein
MYFSTFVCITEKKLQKKNLKDTGTSMNVSAKTDPQVRYFVKSEFIFYFPLHFIFQSILFFRLPFAPLVTSS